MMKVWLKRLVVPLFVVLLASQIFQPARTNPPIDSKREIYITLAVDPGAVAVFQRSCNDCHSNRTVWPWYSHVAPVSWLVVSDVNRGRKALNFSEGVGDRSEEQQKHLSICKEVSGGEMPGFPYTLLHRRAKLSPPDVASICLWTRAPELKASAAAGEE